MATRLLSTLLFLLSLPVTVSGQALRGWVMDDLSGRPLRGASVSILHVAADTVLAVRVTDDGPFQVFMREAGNYRLRVEALGYAPLTTEPVRVPEGVVITLELRVRPNAIALDALRVVAERNEPSYMRDVRTRQEAGWGRFLMREDIDVRGGSVDQILATEPGVSIARIADPTDPSRSVPVVQTRAANLRACYASLYMDGFRVFSADQIVDEEGRQQALDRVRDWMDLRSSDIEAIEVYRGAAEVPAIYSGSTSECGVVALWTRMGYDPQPDARERPDLEVRIAATHTQLTGERAPASATGPEFGIYWQRTARHWIGLRVQYSSHQLAPAITADLTRRLDPRAYALPPGERPLPLYVGGAETYVALLDSERLRALLSARLNYARRSFVVNHAAVGTATYRSRAWGMGGSAGVELALGGRLALAATVSHDWLYFNAFPNLDLPDLRTAATWRALSFRIGLSVAAVRTTQ